MPTLETHNGYPLWLYIPNRPAAVIFTIIFVIITGYHTYLLFRRRLWFVIPFVVGGYFEVIGYLGRILAYDKTGELIPYLLQSIFLLLAPVLFAATLYMTLSRVILAVDGASCSIIRPRWLTAIFVTGDVVSFFIQGGGAGLLTQAKSQDDSKRGEYIIVGGLIFQILIFGVFCATALVFNMRFRRHHHSETYRHKPWQSVLVMLYVTSLLIMARNVFRVVEYAMGHQGYLLSNEWPVYVFDGTLMFFTMAFFALRYPSQLYGGKRVEANIELASGSSASTQRHIV
ncbi:uncharacterized protein E0L32_006132 [Thyridium curvatum]|uniref:RTA1 like protein n=1 Tax=Thyridium curvatum TaxID=1093900 RepID=A0A507ATU3_9PEZI|nr:uncharacterized protein E0L32_006132 [Thyridium curvatum]TPX13402.1 hypothetical protein E0L32_006132 [Thyridium curvatum]